MVLQRNHMDAFSTPNGHFKWLRMLFCLNSVRITFQMMINNLFSDMLGTGVYAYLDDLLVCGKGVETHLGNIEAVILNLRDAGLKAKLAKCEFLNSKICFHGPKVDGGGIHTMEDKLTGIKNIP